MFNSFCFGAITATVLCIAAISARAPDPIKPKDRFVTIEWQSPAGCFHDDVGLKRLDVGQVYEIVAGLED